MTDYAYHCPKCDETFEFTLSKTPKSVACPSCGTTKTQRAKALAGSTGTYRYSEALGTTVRVSARVPGLSKAKSFPSGPGPSCPPQGCGRCN